ncbi:MAG: hypothetical protein HXY50_12090 [Ignavibacteriaceae bacterium]|nr:hypothetical protein [Ignavibacteriaceae bacterium]
MNLAKIGFLESLTLDETSGIMGAILVTDAETKPLEFRVTAPIKTTNFQKTLYGDVLLEHVLVELISIPLITALNEELDLILVKDPLFLGSNNKQGIRVVHIFAQDEKYQQPQKGVEELKSFRGGSQRVFIQTSQKYETELPQIRDLLNSLSEQRNLLEPFNRLRVACEQVHLQKTNE